MNGKITTQTYLFENGELTAGMLKDLLVEVPDDTLIWAIAETPWSIDCIETFQMKAGEISEEPQNMMWIHIGGLSTWMDRHNDKTVNRKMYEMLERMAYGKEPILLTEIISLVDEARLSKTPIE